MADDLTVGAVIAGRYRLERLVAEGGMGVVWAAKHLVTRKPVALKFVKGEAADDERTRRRLLREARAACAVQHPNVVAVHDVMELESGSPVLVMDLLKGESLRAKLDREGRIPLHELANIMTPVISAVGTAHASGVVHRDLKPENIYLADMPGGVVQVKVLDFGIAKLTSTEGIMAQSSVLTGTGLLLGTPDYMSLEQILGEEDVDHRADIWALGIVLYECLDGRRPTAADNVGKVLKIILTNAIPSIYQVIPSLPDEIKALITRMLTLDRTGRPANLIEVGRVFERYATVPLLPFDLPRGRPLSEVPPDAIPSMPSTKLAPPRVPRSGVGEPARTLVPGKPLPPPRPGEPLRPPGKSTVADRRAAEAREIELTATQVAPVPIERSMLASRPMVAPPVPPRDAAEPGMPIALDEPFAEAASPDKQVTMSKSLTLGDLLSPDELVMLGERLERAQSNAPGAAPTSGSHDVMIPPGMPVSPEGLGLSGEAGDADETIDPEPEPPSSSMDDAPISESDIISSSAPGLPDFSAEDGPISSGEVVTKVEQRPKVLPSPAAVGYMTLETLPENVDLSETLPVPLRPEGAPPPPTLPFVPAAGSRRPYPGQAAPAQQYSPPNAQQQQHRLSFADPGGSMSYPKARSSYADATGNMPSPGQPSRGPLRSTEVQTPHTTTSSTPSPSWPTQQPSRRGKLWAALGGLGFLAILAGWWAFAPAHPPATPYRPLDSASATPTSSVAATPIACPPEMISIPGETFAMGGSEGQPDERPVHPVTVQTFCMDVTEVTGVAYQRCVEEGRCEALSRQVSATTTSKQAMSSADRTFEGRFCQDPRRDAAKNHPINCVSWAEAKTYCDVQGKRLPSEEEWEFTARGGNELRLFPWGAAPPGPKLLNACGKECERLYDQLGKKGKSTLFSDSDAQESLSPVGSFPAGASRYGTHDMAGNVWEWTASAYCKYPSHSCSSGNRVFRGGSWASSSAHSFWGTTRMAGAQESRYMDVGFRCAKDKN